MEGDIRIFFHPSLQNVRLNGVAPSGTLINRTTPQAYVVTFTEIVGGVPYHFKGTIGPFNNGTFRLRSRDETTTTPGVTVTETGGATQVSESGNTDTFSVVLDSEPTGDVVIDVTSSDVGEGTVSLNQLTFTTANWNVPQTVTVTGSDDGVIDGDQTFNIALNINTGLTADTYYHASDPADVTATTTDINAIISRTQSVVAEHLAAKGQLILSQNPRLTNRLQQRQPTNANQSNLTSHIELDAVEKPADFQANFSMDGDTTRSLVTLDTSANRLMSYAGAGSGHGLSTSPTDVWVKVRWAKDKTNSRSTDSLLAYVGVDHQISANTLVGFIGQIDTFDTKDQTQSFNASSKGWMLGPYIASEVSENLYLDARVSWGKASNKVSPFNTYTDEFDSTRLMASASLTGSMQGKGHFDGYQIEPELEVSHFQETQEAYV
ncbi:MAG: autotransporter outer membrane beta-barrel domain-containing protein, partial [Alphaproteobacteria bacterium]